jgi:protocatechuate 3,4-dioxygenase beta subunit
MEMLTLLLRRVLPGRLIPFLALWEVDTAARWLYGLRLAPRPLSRISGGDAYREAHQPPRTTDEARAMTDLMDRPFLDQEPDDDQPDETDRGLVYDLGTLDRRRMLQLLGFGGVSASMFVIAGCTPGSGASPSVSASAAASAAAANCAVIPEETAGPFPGDGSNGPDVLNQSGVVRQDIRSSFGSSTHTAPGVPLTIQLTIQDAGDCAPLAGAAVYLWHCDRDGNYSLYSQAAANENYLRGVQEADENGVVTFQSIFPACYSGRWPHVHFEIYPSLAMATNENDKIATSQLALPKDICDQVYATDGYDQSVQNLGRVSLTTDMVFADDGGVRQLGTMSGSVADGLAVALMVPVGA